MSAIRLRSPKAAVPLSTSYGLGAELEKEVSLPVAVENGRGALTGRLPDLYLFQLGWEPL